MGGNQNAGSTSSQGSSQWVRAHNITTLRAYSNPAPVNSMIGFNGKNVNLKVGRNATATNETTAVNCSRRLKPLI